MILDDFLRALGQIGDPRFRGVLIKGLGLTLALLVSVFALVFWLVGLVAPDAVTLPLIGTVQWVDSLLSWGAMALMVVLSAFLMIPVASAFTSIFLDEIAEAVEARHYPHLPPARRIGLTEGLRDSLSFLGVLIAANLVALLVYAILLLTVVLAPLAAFVFWALNGYLLGREYFQLAAMRRLGRRDARAAFARHRLQIWLAGTLMAIPLTIPVMNLVIPVLGAASFTHMFHRLERP